MLNIIIQKLKEQKNGIIYYALGLSGYTWLMVGMFPSMEKANLEELTKNMPEEMMKFFGGEGFNSYSTIEGFLSLEYLSFFFILIICFYIAASAGSTIAGPLEKKTLDFELSQPVSRTKYALSQALVTLVYSKLLVLFNAFVIWILCKAYDVEIKNSGLLAFSVIAVAFIWAIYGISIFFSSIFRSKLSVVLTTIVIIVGFFVYNSLTNIIEKLKDYDKFSLFYLYNPQKLLKTGEINLNHLIILLLIMALGIFSSIVIFNKKDLA